MKNLLFSMLCFSLSGCFGTLPANVSPDCGYEQTSDKIDELAKEGSDSNANFKFKDISIKERVVIPSDEEIQSFMEKLMENKVIGNQKMSKKEFKCNPDNDDLGRQEVKSQTEYEKIKFDANGDPIDETKQEIKSEKEYKKLHNDTNGG